MSALNFAGYVSLLLMCLQLINELRSILTPIRSNFFNGQYFSWKEVYLFIDRLAKRIREDNIQYGMICGTGRGGGILAALLSYKLGLVPVLVLDRKYVIDDSSHTRTSVCIEEAVILDSQFENLYNRPILLITPQSDPGITLDHYKEVLIKSDFKGSIDKCAIIASERTLDVDLRYCLQRYKPDTKCRRFPWERKNPDLMDSPIHIEHCTTINMRNNFEVIGVVPELGNANSYAERLYDYLGKKNQIEWVIDRINRRRSVRSATITTFEPLTDTTYVPCVSLFDFDVVGDSLDVYVYARALDFGSKAPYNLVCIIDILKRVAEKTELACGVVHLICKSAHIFSYDFERVGNMVKDCSPQIY